MISSMAKINKFDVINANNFAKHSDIVFSEYLSTEEFDKYLSQEKDIKILEKIQNDRASFVWYVNTNFTLNENDIVFCNTEIVELLFEKLKSVKTLNNIKLITHQSDRTITKTLFNKKPKCISYWYGTNVAYENPNLIPLPIGINDFTFYNYMNKDVLDKYFYLEHKPVDKIKKLYVNFNFNTNRRERSNLHDYFKNKDWAVVEYPHKDPVEYYKNIEKFKFILCPWGNGYDTYRFWESLYLGSIPITKYHKAYKNFKEFPAIFVNNYKQIDINSLENQLNRSKEKLNIFYWINLINTNRTKSSNSETIIYEKVDLNQKIKNIIKKRRFQRKVKIIKYFISRYINVKNYLRFMRKTKS